MIRTIVPTGRSHEGHGSAANAGLVWFERIQTLNTKNTDHPSGMVSMNAHPTRFGPSDRAGFIEAPVIRPLKRENICVYLYLAKRPQILLSFLDQLIVEAIEPFILLRRFLRYTHVAIISMVSVNPTASGANTLSSLPIAALSTVCTRMKVTTDSEIRPCEEWMSALFCNELDIEISKILACIFVKFLYH